MSILRVTNISGDSLWLRDLYTTLSVDETRTIKRTSAEMGDMIGLQELISENLVTVDIDLEDYEAPSELIAVWPLGLNWRPNVATVGDLPTEKNREGDTRLVSATLEMWVWDGSSWSLVSGGGGSGSVTSIDASGGSTGLTFSGGPVVTAGVLTLGGVLAVGSGGTGATSAAGAQTNLDVPSRSGAGASGTWSIDISGTAASATNVAGGALNELMYQTAAGATSFISAPTVSNTVLKWNGTAFVWAFANGGTVKSVDVSGGTTGISFSGGPVTTTGTLVMSGTLAVANGGTGASTAADARTNLDVPSRSGADATGTWGINISGTAADLAGGSANQIVYQTSANNTSFISTPTASSLFLQWDGNNYVWTSVATGGTVTSVDASGGSTGLGFAGGPITSTGTLTLAGILNLANGGTGANSAAGARTNLDVPTRSGGDATGTWAIDITGNAATADTATNLANGSANQLVFQSGAGTTSFASAPGAGITYLQYDGSNFNWTAIPGSIVPLNYSQTKGTPVTVNTGSSFPVTVVSTTLTTNGNPVQIIVSGEANPLSAGGWGLVSIYRDNVEIGNHIQYESSAGNENNPFALQVVDTPSAGTYVYSLKVKNLTANTQFGESSGPVITAVELGSGVTGGGAPTNAQYVTLATDAALTDERVLAVSADLTLTDGGAGGNATLGFAEYSPTHEAYDTLAHEIVESNYQEYAYASGNVSSITYWTSSAKTLKIRETLYTYNVDDTVNTVTAVQYDGSGTATAQLSSTYSYNPDGTIASIETVRT